MFWTALCSISHMRLPVKRSAETGCFVQIRDGGGSLPEALPDHGDLRYVIQNPVSKKLVSSLPSGCLRPRKDGVVVQALSNRKEKKTKWETATKRQRRKKIWHIVFPIIRAKGHGRF